MRKFSLFNNGTWRANGVRIATGRLVLQLEHLKTGFCDWPIRYADGRIAYDCPERIPAYVKRLTTSLLSPSKRGQWARLQDCEGII